ncbi:phospholipase D-like domain-containing protein [Paenibacillus abyssi]|uniref:phospholipase D n=1 Tax=Paenibacillus abyssi TaxID=1340531 RepID=A0A917D300_9BACL|nr:phospholipase D-like domain-containing protein [Paenibacillus abyssi]GGG07645.1 hypothetical protein GCM10010916_25650 [Paenibacillus abyssi]
MEPITIIFASIAGISVAGYVLYKKKNDLSSQDNAAEIKKIIEEIDPVNNSKFKVAYAFTKTDNPPDVKLKEIIDTAKKSLDIAMYTFTDKGILNRVLHATNRGVKVRLITDKAQTKNANGQYSLIQSLARAGIPVKVNNHQGYMHLKILIADNDKIVTGSYNYTNKAKSSHDEVIVILEDNHIAQKWTDQFNRMWNDENNFREFIGRDSFTNAS